MKKCTACGNEKLETDFSTNKAGKNGLYSQCRECVSKRRRKKYHELESSLKASKLRTNRKRQRRLREKAVSILGGRCVECGFDDPRALQIDHVRGGGTKDRRSGYTEMYRRIGAGDTNGYQLLCANCNWIKRSENKEFTHNTDYWEE